MLIETTVAQVLREKPRQGVLTIEPLQTVYEALQIMSRHDVGALIVVSRGHIAGIISERDYARKVALESKTSRATRVDEVMVSEVHWVKPDDPIEACLSLMTAHNIRHLLVQSSGTIHGIVSMRDVVRTLLDSQEHLIDELMKYIRGSNSGWFDSHGPGRAQIHDRVL